MSINGAPDCPICGAASDYCTLETPVGVSIDCRDLKLKREKDTTWIRAAAWSIANPIEEKT